VLSDKGISVTKDYERLLENHYAKLNDLVQEGSELGLLLEKAVERLRERTMKGVSQFKNLIDMEENQRLLTYY
jgi:hypothetical protein